MLFMGKKMKHWLFLGIAITGEVLATSALKASEGFSKPIPSLVVAIGYISAFYFLSLALNSMSIGIAYAIWAGFGVVFTSIISWVIYGQRLDLPAIIGIIFIISGVVIMNLFSKSIQH